MQTTKIILERFSEYKQYLVPSALFLAGILIGLLASFLKPEKITQDVRTIDSPYTYINPLLECQNVAFENNNNLYNLEHDVQQTIDEAISEGKIITATIYYRDLNNGPWFDVNRDETYSPASLIKVPLMIAVYKIAETDPSFLQKTITIEQEPEYDEQNVVPSRVLVKGQTYTVKDLMERMIIDSDNVAYEILLQNVDNTVLTQVYNDVGIDIEKLSLENPDGNIFTINNYPAFFRILFNASYISRNNSEEALSILARTNYRNGLVAGTPDDTLVAHKYGERRYMLSGIVQLHDCGIIYNPKGPYLLCIMTKGNNFDELESFIVQITKMVDEVHSSGSNQ